MGMAYKFTLLRIEDGADRPDILADVVLEDTGLMAAVMRKLARDLEAEAAHDAEFRRLMARGARPDRSVAEEVMEQIAKHEADVIRERQDREAKETEAAAAALIDAATVVAEAKLRDEEAKLRDEGLKAFQENQAYHEEAEKVSFIPALDPEDEDDEDPSW